MKNNIYILENQFSYLRKKTHIDFSDSSSFCVENYPKMVCATKAYIFELFIEESESYTIVKIIQSFLLITLNSLNQLLQHIFHRNTTSMKSIFTSKELSRTKIVTWRFRRKLTCNSTNAYQSARISKTK